MDKETVITKLQAAGFQVQKSVRMGDNDGWRLSLANSAIIHSFDDGRCIVHGLNAAAMRLALGVRSGDEPRAAAAKPMSR
jgi:hypothetical protein